MPGEPLKLPQCHRFYLGGKDKAEKEKDAMPDEPKGTKPAASAGKRKGIATDPDVIRVRYTHDDDDKAFVTYYHKLECRRYKWQRKAQKAEAEEKAKEPQGGLARARLPLPRPPPVGPRRTGSDRVGTPAHPPTRPPLSFRTPRRIFLRWGWEGEGEGGGGVWGLGGEPGAGGGSGERARRNGAARCATSTVGTRASSREGDSRSLHDLGRLGGAPVKRVRRSGEPTAVPPASADSHEAVDLPLSTLILP